MTCHLDSRPRPPCRGCISSQYAMEVQEDARCAKACFHTPTVSSTIRPSAAATNMPCTRLPTRHAAMRRIKTQNWSSEQLVAYACTSTSVRHGACRNMYRPHNTQLPYAMGASNDHRAMHAKPRATTAGRHRKPNPTRAGRPGLMQAGRRVVADAAKVPRNAKTKPRPASRPTRDDTPSVLDRPLAKMLRHKRARCGTTRAPVHLQAQAPEETTQLLY